MHSQIWRQHQPKMRDFEYLVAHNPFIPPGHEGLFLQGIYYGLAGDLMIASHGSLRDLYQTSTPVIEAAAETLAARPGVYGARMTGGGFGGCLVALTRPGALEDGWRVHAVDGAHHVKGEDEQ